MIVTLHQPEHLPWLGYFHKMAQADVYVFVDQVQYRHQYFQNRNLILGTPGALWLNVPVRCEQHRYGPINAVRIDDSRDWRRAYWGSIEHHYHRHPFFDAHGPALHEIVFRDHEHLVEFNYALIDYFRGVLGIDTPLLRASTLPTFGARNDMILGICKHLGARRYLSGPTGRDYLEEAPFERAGIEVAYHAFAHPVYPQRGRADFTPRLSTLDLVMNCGPDARRILLAGREATQPPVYALAG